MSERVTVDAETLARLAKILARTQSGFDGEALAAARKAAALLARQGITYGELFGAIGTFSDPAIADEINHLKWQLARERKKSEALASALRQKDCVAASAKGSPFLESLEHLRLYLMEHFSLKQHERDLLERVEHPKPKSKEAHIVLICAQRYGVVFG